MPAFNIGELFGTVTIRGTSEATSGLGRVQAGFTGAGDAAERSAGAVGAAEAALNGAGRAAGMASTSQAKLRAAQLSSLAATERYNTVLADENASLGRLASAEAAAIRATERLGAAETAAAPAVERLGAAQAIANEAALRTPGAMARAGSSFVSAARSASGLVAMFGAFEIVKKAIDITKEANAYQAAMVRIHTLTGTSAAEVNAMSTALLGLSGKVAQSPEDLATSLYHMKSIGLDAKDALNGVEVAAKGADIGNASLEDTTNALTSTMASGITQGQSFSKTMSELLTIVGTGDMKLTDFNETLATGGLSVLKQYGLSLSDVGAAVATFGDNNIRGRQAIMKLVQSVQSMAVVAPKGQAALAHLGIGSDQLAHDLETGGLNKAITDLRDHLHAAGVSSKQTGQVLTEIFTKRAGAGLSIMVDQAGRLASKYEMLDHGVQTFGERWTATTKTTSFALDRIGARFEAAGISLAEKLTPDIATAVNWLGNALPHALSVLQSDLLGTERVVGGVFVGAWHALLAVLGPVAAALASVGHFLAEHQGLTTGVATGVLAMWAAWKAFTIARTAMTAVNDALLTMKANFGSATSAMRAQSTTTAAIMESDFAQIAAAAETAAAEQAVAFAQSTRAYATMVAASDDATANMVANSEAVAAAAQTSADEQIAAAAAAADAAKARAAEVDAAGSVASVGWAAALGPLAAIGLGVGLLTGLFSSNSDAAEQNKSIMDAYAQSLQKSSNALADVNIQATAKNLKDQGAIDLAHQLTEANVGVGLGYARLTLAVNGSQQQFDSLHASLLKVADANKNVLTGPVRGPVPEYNATGRAAVALADKITQLRGDMTKQMKAQAELTDIQHKAQVAVDGGTSAVANQSRGLHLTTDAYINAQLAAKQNTAQTKAQTAAFQAEGDAASLLQQALDGLAGVNLSLAQARTALRSANQAVTDSFKKSKDVINGASKDAVAHQQALQGEVSAAQQLAKGIGDADRARGHAAKGEQDEIASLKASKQAIEDRLSAQGKLTPAVQSYIDHLYNVKGIEDYLNQHPVAPKVDANTSPAEAKIKRVQSIINAIKQGKFPDLKVNSQAAEVTIEELQAKIDRMRGKTLYVNVVNPGTGPARATKAAGGQITGPGTGTSDSVPIMASNGEFVVNARQTARNLPLLNAINSGAGFAAGGKVTGRTAETRASSALTSISLDSSTFSWMKFGRQIAAATQSIKDALAAGISHSQYVSLQQRLHRAEQRGREIEHKLDAAGRSEAAKLSRAVSNVHNVASGSDVIGQIHSLEATLRQAGLPRDFIKGLADENKQILGLVASRNRAAAMLAKANAAMAKAKSAEMQDFRSFRSATVGGFDITTAGQNANGVVTAGSLLASQNQDLARTKAWVSGIDKLAGMKIFPGAYLRQLVGAGPASLGTVRALLSMKHGQLAQFARQERQIFALGTDVSQHVVARLDTKRLREADKREQHAQKREDKRQEKLEGAIRDEMRALGHEIKHLHLEGKLHLTRGELALIVEAGQNDNHKRRGHKS